MRITEITPNVFAVEGASVNWTLLTEGDAVTLVDAGYPGDHDTVIASIREIGRRPEDVEAVLVTHAHVDHVGSLPRFVAKYPVPVLTSDRETAHVRRELLEQASPLDIAVNLWRPGVLPWVAHILRAGALRDVTVPRAAPYPGARPLPGHPIAIPTPGHTSGHTAWLVPEAKVLLSGDALVTGHALARAEGPQMLLGFFHHDVDAAWQALDAIAAVEADVVIPGHGPVFIGSPRDAVALARR